MRICSQGGAAGFSKSTTIVFEDSNVSQKHPKPQPDGSGVSVGHPRAETEGDNKGWLPVLFGAFFVSQFGIFYCTDQFVR